MNTGCPLCAIAKLAEDPLAKPGVPKIAMSELLPGCYWVMVNFPHRTAISLCTMASKEQAVILMEAARTVASEALSYAAEVAERCELGATDGERGAQ